MIRKAQLWASYTCSITSTSITLNSGILPQLSCRRSVNNMHSLQGYEPVCVNFTVEVTQTYTTAQEGACSTCEAAEQGDKQDTKCSSQHTTDTQQGKKHIYKSTWRRNWHMILLLQKHGDGKNKSGWFIWIRNMQLVNVCCLLLYSACVPGPECRAQTVQQLRDHTRDSFLRKQTASTQQALVCTIITISFKCYPLQSHPVDVTTQNQ